jgi:hypothetical protein
LAARGDGPEGAFDGASPDVTSFLDAAMAYQVSENDPQFWGPGLPSELMPLLVKVPRKTQPLSPSVDAVTIKATEPERESQRPESP